jgi:transposase
MNKSFEGLSAAVERLFPNELFSGAFFVFLNKRKDLMKVLFWDNDGFVIYFKRLERGTFCHEQRGFCLDRRGFFMLLEGIVPKKLQKRFSL